MYKLLVEYPDGNQQVVEITGTGGFFDQSRVLWDERADGSLPEDFELGKMSRANGKLIKSESFIPGHVAYINEKNQEIINNKIADLWASADAFINTEINGVGLCLLSAGVQQQNPKALAVAAWCDSIWAEYYVRKGLITAENSVSNDFSSFGSKPYTVLELREEVASLWTGD